jgi:hypothetical protein
MGVLRVLAGVAMALSMTAAWMLLAVLVALVTLYLTKLVPLAGMRRRPTGRRG